MKVGDKLDAMAIGHLDIDIKTMMKESGYYVPQVSMAKMPEIPEAVQTKIAAAKDARKAYDLGLETKVFVCKVCGARCSAQSRVEVATGDEAFVCGACNTVAEVL